MTLADYPYNAPMTTSVSRGLIAIAALLMAVATALGAYASHGLDTVLDAAALNSFETAVYFQFIHALGLIGIAIYGERCPEAKTLNLAGLLLLIGIVLFCGGVYASSTSGPDWIGRLAPTGGISLIAGWIIFAAAVGLQLAADRR